MIVMFCRKKYLLIELNAFKALTNKSASDDWSSYIVLIACISDS